MSGTEGEKPSRASMREVKREFKARRKAEQQRAAAAAEYWDAQLGRPRSGNARSGRTTTIVAVGALVAAAGVAGVVAVKAVGGLPSTAAGASLSSTSPSTTRAPSPAPTGSASTGADTGDGTDPAVVAAFQDSPARGWKVGSQAITTPRATQVGIFRASQVQDAYAKTARYLSAALLDPRVNYKGRLEPVFATLGSPSTTYLKQRHARKGAKQQHWDTVANRFHPGDWKAAAEVRAKGKMSASIDSKRGELKVHFVYVTAYWLVPRTGGPARTVAVRRTGDVYFAGNGSQRVSPPLYGGSGYTSTASVCGSQWKHPDYIEAWTNTASAPLASAVPEVGSSFDVADLDAAEPTGCFTDSSGF